MATRKYKDDNIRQLTIKLDFEQHKLLRRIGAHKDDFITTIAKQYVIDGILKDLKKIKEE